MEAFRNSYIPLLLRCVNCPDLHDRNKAKMRFLSVFLLCRKTVQRYDNFQYGRNYFFYFVLKVLFNGWTNTMKSSLYLGYIAGN